MYLHHFFVGVSLERLVSPMALDTTWAWAWNICHMTEKSESQTGLSHTLELYEHAHGAYDA